MPLVCRIVTFDARQIPIFLKALGCFKTFYESVAGAMMTDCKGRPWAQKESTILMSDYAQIYIYIYRYINSHKHPMCVDVFLIKQYIKHK